MSCPTPNCDACGQPMRKAEPQPTSGVAFVCGPHNNKYQHALMKQDSVLGWLKHDSESSQCQAPVSRASSL